MKSSFGGYCFFFSLFVIVLFTDNRVRAISEIAKLFSNVTLVNLIF